MAVNHVLSPRGSGGFIRRMVDTTMRVVRELDEAVAFTPRTPPSFDLGQLGQILLFHVSEDGQFLTVWSLTQGKAFQWHGRTTPRTEIWKRLPHLQTDQDKASFIDYVYNFQYVKLDLTTMTMEIMNADEAADAVLVGTSLRVPSVYRAALG